MIFSRRAQPSVSRVGRPFVFLAPYATYVGKEIRRFYATLAVQVMTPILFFLKREALFIAVAHPFNRKLLRLRFVFGFQGDNRAVRDVVTD